LALAPFLPGLVFPFWALEQLFSARLAEDLTVSRPRAAPFQRGFSNPGKAVCPVIAAACDWPHPVAAALDPKAVAVIFDFVEPFGASGNLGPGHRDAELKGLKHALKIGILDRFYESAVT
jgi:hypothetical protein